VTETPKVDANKIFVCKDTNVSIAITDTSGTPNVRARTEGISCTPTGCTILNIQTRQRYKSTSADSKDKDTIQIRVEDEKD
jgi:hypothetical protein